MTNTNACPAVLADYDKAALLQWFDANFPAKTATCKPDAPVVADTKPMPPLPPPPMAAPVPQPPPLPLSTHAPTSREQGAQTESRRMAVETKNAAVQTPLLHHMGKADDSPPLDPNT